MTEPEWSDEELKSAISAYIQMQRLEIEGKPFTKAEFNRRLRESDSPLANRSRGSIEYRMQNISAVLQDAGLPILKGYAPRKNVGEQTRLRILKIREVLDRNDDTHRR
jgi:DNA-binding XRE family transcriptional regulator